MASDPNHDARATARHPDHFLAEWRDYKELNQMQLGDALGVSHSKISRIETGETELKPSFAKRLARFFHIPMVAIYTINPRGEGKQTADMLTSWANIPQNKRDAALRMLRALEDADDNSRTG